jgi:hypothetical protein
MRLFVSMVAFLATPHLGSADDLELELAKREVARIEAVDTSRELRARLDVMLGEIHPEARACIDDDSALVAVRGTRRSGKSRSFIRSMLDTAASEPHARVFYFNETLPECERIVWVGNGRDGLLTLNERFDLGGKANHSKHTLTFPSGGVVELIGADDMRAVNRARGSSPRKVVLDEAQKMPHLQALIRDSLGASMMDAAMIGRRGQIIMVGTPSEDLAGLFFDVTNEEEPLAGWSVHVLNVLANPFFGASVEERYANTVLQYCKDHGLSPDDPTVQREWFAKWVKEGARFTYAVHSVPEHELCYAPPRWLEEPRWRKDKDGKRLFLEGGVVDFAAALKDLPTGIDWQFTIGCDLGFLPDPFAYVLWAWSWEWTEMLEVASWAKTEMDSDDQLAHLSMVAEHALPTIVTGDVGGTNRATGKGWSKRLNERFRFGIDEAEKHRKHEFIQLLNTDLRKLRARVRRGSPLHEQLKRVRNLPPAPGGKLKEDPEIPNDITDAGLYGHRHTYQHLAQRAPDKPKPGTDAYYQDLERRMEQDELDRLEQAPDSYYEDG